MLNCTESMATDRLVLYSIEVSKMEGYASKPYANYGARDRIDVRSSTTTYPCSGVLTAYKRKDVADIMDQGPDAILELFHEYITGSPTRQESVSSADALYITYAEGTSYSATSLAAEAFRKIENFLHRPRLGGSPELKSFGDLTAEAAATADSNAANMIAFVRDLKDVKSLIPKLKNLSSIKTHASNYLGYNYGIAPTIGDLESIVSALQKDHWLDSFGNQILTSSHRSTYDDGFYRNTALRRVKLVVSNEDGSLSRLVRKVRSAGFYPSPQNLWDLVPYSFVLDWFVDIGGMLEKWDQGMRVAQLPILACTTSEKVVHDLKPILTAILPGFVCNGTLTYYDRQVSTDAPKVSLTFDSDFTAHRHLVEGSALILSRK